MTLKFTPKIDKILELLLYLAHKLPDSDKYQAVKFFYLADREHLIQHGRPITHEIYYALPYGPVASTAKDFLENNAWVMSNSGISELPFETYEKEVDGRVLLYIGKPKREVDTDLFSKSDLRVFDKILEDYGECDFDELFKITHKHVAYKKAWDSRKPGSKRAEMQYHEMIEDAEKQALILEDIGPVAEHIE